ncbi:hypothetical protein VaNZ11_014142 [Volvox africanus]|uniref:Uncharacterized protein n=1 Tax=Volvox africanus TaxID=51714 RepID=A0ABQ5SJ54_9CHLO|nr:hypothetical protein VaNZ11_014142 [Volvox africanus]
MRPTRLQPSTPQIPIPARGRPTARLELDQRLGLLLRNVHVPLSDMEMKQRLSPFLKIIFQGIQGEGAGCSGGPPGVEFRRKLETLGGQQRLPPVAQCYQQQQ